MTWYRVRQSRPEANTGGEGLAYLLWNRGRRIRSSSPLQLHNDFQVSLSYMTPKQKKTEAKADKGRGWVMGRSRRPEPLGFQGFWWMPCFRSPQTLSNVSYLWQGWCFWQVYIILRGELSNDRTCKETKASCLIHTCNKSCLRNLS